MNLEREGASKYIFPVSRKSYLKSKGNDVTIKGCGSF